MIEIIYEIKFKNLSRILNIFKKETLQVHVATVPEVISTINRIFTSDKKKDCVRVFLTVVKFASPKL